MGAFDTSITPVGLTPANTNEASLFTVGTGSVDADTQVLVNVSVVGASGVSVRVGILPSGGSVVWVVYDDTVAVDDPLIGLGPFFLQSDDAIRVRTASANDVDFSLTGTRTS